MTPTSQRRSWVAKFGWGVRSTAARQRRETELEFVSLDEIGDLLDDYGIEEVADGPDRTRLCMIDGEGVVHLHLGCPEATSKPQPGATVFKVEKSRLAAILEHAFHLLNIKQVALVPVGKWRKVFDAVAFSMVQNSDEHVAKDWQEIEAAATVELNRRDPLLCEPGDLHTLVGLIQSLLKDAESPDQGLMLIATASPVLVELVPDGAVRMSLGSQVLADEVAEAFSR